MSVFNPGDRVRYETTDDDGFPIVRYGFIGGANDGAGPVVVMLDGELGGDVVEVDKLQPVHVGNVHLRLDGADLLDDPSLRQGLVRLWQAEAEDAGLQICALHAIGTGVQDTSEGFALAELSAGGEHYLLRARRCPGDPDAVLVQAERPRTF